MMEFSELGFEHDGVRLAGQMLSPDQPGKHPAVLVMHTAHGLGSFVKERARRLADLGYVALATDMYGAGTHFGAPQDAGGPFTALQNNPNTLRDRVVSWYELLKAQPQVDPQRIAAIGFCFGGQCVLELARSGAEVKACVSFHGLLNTSMPAQAGAVTGEVAIYHGAKDPFVPREHVRALEMELNEANARWQLTIFNEACHAFTDPESNKMNRAGVAYHALADEVSWAGTVALLNRVLQAAPAAER